MPQPKVELTGASGYKVDVTASNALKVDVAGASFTTGDINVHLTNAEDSIAVYGNDGGDNQVLKTHTDGKLRIHDINETVTVGGSVSVNTVDVSALSTHAKQDTMITALGEIEGAVETIEEAYADDGAAYGKGVLLQGDDGSDRHNVIVDNNGRLKVKIDSFFIGGVNHPVMTVGTQYGATDANILATVAVRTDTNPAALANVANGDWSSLQVNADGALYVKHSETVGITAADNGIIILGAKADAKNTATDTTAITMMQVLKQISFETQAIYDDTDKIAGAIGISDIAAGTDGMRIMGVARTIDGDPLPLMSHEGDSTRLHCSVAGVQFTHITSENGTASAVVIDDVGNAANPAFMSIGGEYRASDDDYTDGDSAILHTDIRGNLKTTHSINGMVSDDNSGISDTTAEQLDGSTDSSLDVACKRVDLMSHPANTGYIWVGDSGVATNGSGGGIRLAAGDFYSIDVNNLNDIWLIATVNDENITFNYFT